MKSKAFLAWMPQPGGHASVLLLLLVLVLVLLLLLLLALDGTHAGGA
mgnify:CR=1 FL=1